MRFKIAGTVAVAVLAVMAAFAMVLNSNWLQDRAREEVIAGIEKATGTTVQMQSFHLYWGSQTLEVHGLVLHSSEESGALPLVAVEFLRARFRITSLLGRNLQLSQLEVRRPQINVIVRPDGTTNLPSVTAGGQQKLGSLKASTMHVWDGWIAVNLRRIPFSFTGEDVAAIARYDAASREYMLDGSLRKLEAPSLRSLNGNLDLSIRLGSDHAVIKSLHYFSKASNVQLKGTLTNFTRPQLQFNVAGKVAAAELGVREVRSGDFDVSGSGFYRGVEDWTFNGRVRGRNLKLRSQLIEASTSMAADANEIEFTGLEIRSAGTRFAGQGELADFQRLVLEGRLEEMNLRAAAALLGGRDLPWTGIASGPVKLQARVEKPIAALALRDLTADAELTIRPVAGGIPISGQANVRYRQRGNELAFSRAEIALPHSRLALEGVAGRELQASIDSTDLSDLGPLVSPERLPAMQAGGTAHFDGAISGPLRDLTVAGNIGLTRVEWHGNAFDEIRSRLRANSQGVQFDSLSLTSATLHVKGSGNLQLAKWQPRADANVEAQLQFTGVELGRWVVPSLPPTWRGLRGVASGAFEMSGRLNNPQGRGQVEVAQLQAFGEQVTKLQAVATVSGNHLRVTSGHLQDGPAAVQFSGAYDREGSEWSKGTAQIKMDSNTFPLSVIDVLHRYNPQLEAQSELHAQLTADIRPGHVDLKEADGSLVLRRISVEKTVLGDLTFRGRTDGQLLQTGISGNLRTTRLSGQAEIQLVEGNPAHGQIEFDRVSFATLRSILQAGQSSVIPLEGWTEGRLQFDGPLEQPGKIHARVELKTLELRARNDGTDLSFQNAAPVVIDASDGQATIREFKLRGRGTGLSVSGVIPYLQGQREAHLNAKGSVDLAMLQAFNPALQSSGQAMIAMDVSGTWRNPKASGTVAVSNGALAVPNLPTAVTELNGEITFNQSRATIQKLTAQTGGGRLSLAGFLNYGAGPIVYSLTGNAEEVRVRYAGGISVTASSQLQLTGTSERSILSGSTTVSRVILNPSTDVGNLLESVATPTSAPGTEKDFLTGLQFDVAIESAPNLQLSTAFSSDVQAEIDLRLRGTLNNPALLGSIYVNEGDVKVFGSRYSINRGEVSFVNAARIEPVLDLDVQTQVRGIIVNITIAGTLGRLNINYRSDPPLQPRDIIALLTVGRTPEVGSNVPTSQTANDVTSLQTGANTVLGQAFAPASNRLSKLFGITNIKIDPLVQNLTTTPQARLTLEQQISKQISVTYVTNLSQTSEQIFRVEWAFSGHYSVVALRDDNGEFGIDIQYRRRFK